MTAETNANTSQQSNIFNINSNLNSCQSNKTLQSPYQQLQQQQLPIQQVSSFKPSSIKPDNNQQQQQKMSKVRNGAVLNSMIPPLDLQRIVVQKRQNVVTDRSLSPCNSASALGLVQNGIYQTQQQYTERINVNDQSQSNRQPYHMVSGYFSSRQPYTNHQSSVTNNHGSKSPISNRDQNQKNLIMSRMNWLLEIRNIFETIEKQGKASIQDLVMTILSKQDDLKLLDEEKYNEKCNELGFSLKDIIRELRYYKNQLISIDEIFDLIGNIQPEQAKIKRCINIFQQGDKTYEQIEKMRRKVNSSNSHVKMNTQASLERNNSQNNNTHINGITIQTQLPNTNYNSHNPLKTPKNAAITNINTACNTVQNTNINSNPNITGSNQKSNGQSGSNSKHQYSHSCINNNINTNTATNNNNSNNPLAKSRKNLQEVFQEQEQCEKDQNIPTFDSSQFKKNYFPSSRNQKRDQMKLKHGCTYNQQVQNITNVEISRNNFELLSSPVNKTSVSQLNQNNEKELNKLKVPSNGGIPQGVIISSENDKQNNEKLVTLANEEIEIYKLGNNGFKQQQISINKKSTESGINSSSNVYNIQQQNQSKIPPLPNTSRGNVNSNSNLPPKQNQITRYSSVGKFQSPQSIKKLSNGQLSNQSSVAINSSSQFKSPDKSIKEEITLSPSQYFLKQPSESIKKHSQNDLLNNFNSNINNNKKIKTSQSQTNIFLEQQQQLQQQSNLYQNQPLFTNNLVQSTNNNLLISSNHSSNNSNPNQLINSSSNVNNNKNNINSLKNNIGDLQKYPINIKNISNNLQSQEKRINTEDHDIETARFHREDSLKYLDSARQANQHYFQNSNEGKSSNRNGNEENIVNSKGKKVIVITQQQQAEALAFSQRGIPPKKLVKVNSQSQLFPNTNLQSNVQSAISSTRANQSNEKYFPSLANQQQQQQEAVQEGNINNSQNTNIQRQSSSLTLKQQLKQLGLQQQNAYNMYQKQSQESQQQEQQQIPIQQQQQQQNLMQKQQLNNQQNKLITQNLMNNNESLGNGDYMINSPFTTQMNISAIKMNESCMKNVTLQDIATELMALGETNNKEMIDISKLMQTTITAHNNTTNLAASVQNMNSSPNIFNPFQSTNNIPAFASGNNTPKTHLPLTPNSNQSGKPVFSSINLNHGQKSEVLASIIEKVAQENNKNEKVNAKQVINNEIILEESDLLNQNEQRTPSASPTLNQNHIQSIQSDDEKRELTFSSRAMQRIMQKRQLNFNQNSINNDSTTNNNQSRISFQQNGNSNNKNLNTSANLSSNTKYNNDPSIFSFNDSANKHLYQNIPSVQSESQGKQRIEQIHQNISDFDGQFKKNNPTENLCRILDKEFPTGLAKQQDEMDDSLADFLATNNLTEYIALPGNGNNQIKSRNFVMPSMNKEQKLKQGIHTSFGNNNNQVNQSNFDNSNNDLNISNNDQSKLQQQKTQSFINISATQQISNIDNDDFEIDSINNQIQFDQDEEEEETVDQQSIFARLQIQQIDEDNQQIDFDQNQSDEEQENQIQFKHIIKEKKNSYGILKQVGKKDNQSNQFQSRMSNHENKKRDQQQMQKFGCNQHQEYPSLFGENQILTQSYNDESSNFFTVKSQFEKTSLMFKDLVNKMQDECNGNRNMSENKRQLLSQVCNYIPYEDNELPFYAIKFDYLKNIPEHIEVLSTQMMRQYFQNAQALKITFSQIEKIPQFSSIVNSNLLHNNLRILNISFNSIKSLKSITTSDLHNLEFLNISYNYLENLDGLENLYKLRELHAQNNKISFIHPKNTAPLELIRQIDLQNNLIPNIEALVALQQNKLLELLNFQGNPLTIYPNYSKHICKLLSHVQAIDIPDPNIMIYTLSDYSKYREICFIDDSELKAYQVRQSVKLNMLKNSQDVQKKVSLLSVNTNAPELQQNKYNSNYLNNVPSNLQSPSKKILQYRSLSPQSNNQFQSFVTNKVQAQSSFYFSSNNNNNNSNSQNQQQGSQSLKQSNMPLINQISQSTVAPNLIDNQDCKQSYYFQTERGSHSNNQQQQMMKVNSKLHLSSASLASNSNNIQSMPQIQQMKKSNCSNQSENSLQQQSIEQLIHKQKTDSIGKQLNIYENQQQQSSRQKLDQDNSSSRDDDYKQVINYNKKSNNNIYQMNQNQFSPKDEFHLNININNKGQFASNIQKDMEYYYQDENVNELNLQHSQSQQQFYTPSISHQSYQSNNDYNKPEDFKKITKIPVAKAQQIFQNNQQNVKQQGQLSQLIKMKINKAQIQAPQPNPKKF